MSVEVVIGAEDHSRVSEHLFRPDRDEHAAILLAGVHRSARGTRLLAREVHLVEERDFPPGERGYRQIAPALLARLANRAREERLAFVSTHSHPGAGKTVGLSSDDLAAHRRVFPHLLDITDGMPAAGLAFGQQSAAGELWSRDQSPQALDRVRVIGAPLRELRPSPLGDLSGAPEGRFDRQVRMFGAEGQRTLRRLRVGVVGAGGGGSLLIEQLAHLGVGSIVAIDFDTVAEHNLSRIVGAKPADARQQRKKIDVAQGLVSTVDPSIDFVGIDGDVADIDVARVLTDCDFILLATDTATSRLVVNAVAQAYLIPTVQIGAKVETRLSGELEAVYAAVRPIFPGRGCLQCAGLIDPMALQHEAISDHDRAAQNYLNSPEIVDPSVVTLNATSAAGAMNVLLMSAVGLARPHLLNHRLFDATQGDWLALEPTRTTGCPYCGPNSQSQFARGDDAQLPCRTGQPRRLRATRRFGVWLWRPKPWRRLVTAIRDGGRTAFRRRSRLAE
jgi:molybdopterin/thiamine biosynthesis adenylyltransferase